MCTMMWDHYFGKMMRKISLFLLLHFPFLSIFSPQTHIHTQSQWIFFLLFSSCSFFNPKCIPFDDDFLLFLWFLFLSTHNMIYVWNRNLFSRLSMASNWKSTLHRNALDNDFQLQWFFSSEWWKLFLIERFFFCFRIIFISNPWNFLVVPKRRLVA